MTKTQKTLEDIRFEAMEKFLVKKCKSPKKVNEIHEPKGFPERLEDLFLKVTPDEFEKNAKKIADMMRKNNWDVRKSYNRSTGWSLSFGETRVETEEEIREDYQQDAFEAGMAAVRREKAKRKKARDLAKSKADKAKKAKVLAKLTKEERKVLGI